MASAGPLSAVLEAMRDGAHLRTDVSRRTGLDPDVVDAAIDQLVRMGRLPSRPLLLACPASGCSSCPATGC